MSERVDIDSVLSALTQMAGDPERELSERVTLTQLTEWLTEVKRDKRRARLARSRLLRAARKYHQAVRRLNER